MQIVAQVELKTWLGSKGANIGHLPGLNKGGTQEIDGIHFTLVNAFHSSSSDEGEYLGEACGLVIRLEGGRAVYFAGDTCVFGDMALIARIYAPDYAVLPIGDHFTMGPREAARRARPARQPAVHSVSLRDVPAADRHARSSFRSRRRTRPSSSSGPATRCCSIDT